MRIYDLWMDESGTFDSEKRNILGGFLLPRPQNSREENASYQRNKENTFSRWLCLARDDVKQKASQLVAEQYPNQPDMSDRLTHLLDEYNWTHCEENSSNDMLRLRRWLQPEMLGQLADKIRAQCGQIVIFDNSDRYVFVDDNTNHYLTMVAKGLYLLYCKLCDEVDQQEEVRLYAHFAWRRNMTRREGEEEGIPEETYRNHAKICISSIDAVRVSSDYGLAEMIDTISVTNGPTTASVVIGDFISNTYCDGTRWEEARRSSGYKRTFCQDACKVFDVFCNDEPTITLEDFRWEGSFFLGFQRLKRKCFPSQYMTAFFEQLVEAGTAAQKQFISDLVNELSPRVYDHRDNLALRQEIEGIMRACSRSNLPGERLAELNANLYLFLHALCTHMCDARKIREVGDNFLKSVSRVNDSAIKNDLMIMYSNRMIVYYTDSFRWDDAQREYDRVQNYFKNQLPFGFDAIDEGGEKTRYEQLGRTTGSYLQLLRHQLRNATSEYDREIYYVCAQDAYKVGYDNFSDEEGLSRHHQNICDVEAEMKQFDSAFDHLCRAALYSARQEISSDQYGISPENCRMILDITGNRGQQRGYVFNHYARLMQEMYIADDDRASILLTALGTPLTANQVEFPITGASAEACRSIGSSLARSSGHRNRDAATSFFERAIEITQRQQEPLYEAMAVSFRAELIALAEQLHADENTLRTWKAKLASGYERYQTLRCQLDPESINPFETLQIDMQPGSASGYFRIARAIAY